MANIFDGPPALVGDEQRQLEALYRYLQVMSDQLNESMNSITLENFAPQTMTRIQTAIQGPGGGTDKKITDARNALRSMIIKSAEIVRTEMQEIKTELTDQYMAASREYGDLNRRFTDEIEATGQGIKQNFTYIEELTDRTNNNETYITRMNNYIYSGVIGEDDSMQPIYGIAIGEGVTKYDQEGNPYLDDNAKVATFTKDRLSFWHGTKEMAYFSDRTMYITDAEILNRLRMGNYVWKIQQDGSMGLTVEKKTGIATT